MAVCNLFKEFTKETGNYLMFSQYADDLTRMATESYVYQVVPSRFVALDVDYTKFTFDDDSTNLNIIVPKYMQNIFENSCAFLKSGLQKDVHGTEWTPEISSNLFWRSLVNCGIINLIEEDNDKYYCDSVRWIGDINMQSYDEKNGLGYSELFCYIPNDADNYKYYAETILTDNEDSFMVNESDVIEGCTVKDFLYKDVIIGLITPPSYYHYKKKYDFAFLNSDYNSIKQNSKYFDINTIVVLYDIVSKDSAGNTNVLYKDIPMGFYVTGLINSDGTVGNTIRKYVSNEDIYNEGTSYGLRICSRYTINPNNINITSTEISSESEIYSAFCQVMSKMGDTLNEMSNTIKKVYETSQINKDLLAIFKNNRTNVPYLKEVNGKNYWFVNGRNMGVEGTSVLDNSSPDLVSMEDNEVTNILNRP